MALVLAALYPSPPPPPPPPDVPTITKSIGTSKDYSTISSWEADLDLGSIYAAGDTALGECYNNVVGGFDEALTLNGGGTIGLAGIRLSVAAGERHNGTAGTGARMVATTARAWSIASGALSPIIEWLEWDANGTNSTFALSGTSANTTTYRYLLLHSIVNGGGGISAMNITLDRAMNVHNCMVYDISSTAGTAAVGINCATTPTRAQSIYNCTVHDISHTTAARCYGFPDDVDITIKNCIGTDPTGTAATKVCFQQASPSNATVSNNLSSDTTASGSGSLTSKTSANQFVSTTHGSEDLHLKSGADAIDAGTDLATSPSGVELDIDGYDRDAGGVTWDIGADEYVATGGQPLMRRFGLMADFRVLGIGQSGVNIV